MFVHDLTGCHKNLGEGQDSKIWNSLGDQTHHLIEEMQKLDLEKQTSMNEHEKQIYKDG